MLSAVVGSVGMMMVASATATDAGAHPLVVSLVGGLLIGLAPSVRDEAVVQRLMDPVGPPRPRF